MRIRSKKTDPIEQLTRLLELLVRLKLWDMKADRSQKEMILLLGDVGMNGGEIASFLGISRTTVDPTLSKARRVVGAKNKPRARKG